MHIPLPFSAHLEISFPIPNLIADPLYLPNSVVVVKKCDPVSLLQEILLISHVGLHWSKLILRIVTPHYPFLLSGSTFVFVWRTTLESAVKMCNAVKRRLLHENEAKRVWSNRQKVKVKVRTLDVAPLCESPPQKRSGMACFLKRSHSFTCTPTRSSAIGMSIYLSLPCQL